MIDLEKLNHGYFAPFVGEKFTFVVGDSTIEMQLALCELLKQGPHDGKETTRHPFRVRFETESENRISQGTCTVKCPDNQELQLFVVPVNEKAYEAIFN